MTAVDYSTLMVACAASLTLGIALVLTQRWHGRLTLDHTEGIQKFHTIPTPRIGGVPVFAALLLVQPLLEPGLQTQLNTLLLAGLAAFAFGLAEDLTKRVSVMTRLLATMASGVAACWLSGYSLTRLDVIGLDWALQWLPLSVLFTAFAVGGVANAINISDGLNGLASSSSVWAFIGLGLIAASAGDFELAELSLLLAAAVLGFFLVNWPLGKIFLGDGGAYFIGFALAWVAVLLAERNPGVSPFAALLVCVHPITEVLFSIYRRKVRHYHPGHPDQLHFHSLVKRRYVARWFARFPKVWRNSIAGLLVGSMTLPAAVLAQLVYPSTALSLASVLLCMLGYVALYARMVRHHWCSPVAFLLCKPVAALPKN
jgi:UDP-N-acetylmuramyl pentapeptide phosphotransferase/UDP-N-acetylglucosamine-1-phosphate transferase